MTRTLILIPGLLSDAAVWFHQKTHLSVYAEIRIPDLSFASTPEEMVETVLAGAPDKFTVAGHSMGGWVALELFRNVPSRIEKLCLLNTTAASDSSEKADSRREMIAMVERGEFDAVVDRLLRVFLFREECRETIRKMFFRNMAAFVNEERAMLMRSDCMSILSRIHCPTLIIHAEEDAVFGTEDSEMLYRNIRGSRLARIPGCGHMSPMEAPEKVTELMLAWLSQMNT